MKKSLRDYIIEVEKVDSEVSSVNPESEKTIDSKNVDLVRVKNDFLGLLEETMKDIETAKNESLKKAIIELKVNTKTRQFTLEKVRGKFEMREAGGDKIILKFSNFQEAKKSVEQNIFTNLK